MLKGWGDREISILYWNRVRRVLNGITQDEAGMRMRRADLQCVKSLEESVKSCSGWLKIPLDLSRLLGSVLREMKKPNILKNVEDYFSERRQLWGVFSGDS